jgi:hypothetical protein
MNKRLVATLLLGLPVMAGAQSAPAAKPDNVGQAQPGPPISMQGRETVDASVPEKLRAKIATAQVQGALLHQEDAAVWVASGALARAGITVPTGATATGWLAQPANPQAFIWKVSFTARQAQREFAYADIDVDLTAPPPKFRVLPHEKGRDLSADELVLAKARDAVDARADWLRCSNIYNYFADFADGAKGRDTVVRAVPARTDSKLYLFGGFHEFTAPAAGGKARHFEQTTDCLELPLQSGAQFMVTSQLSKTPTLFHVFASLSYQKPVFVKTDGRTWKVDAGRVTVVDKKSLKTVKAQEPAAK